MDAEFFVLLGFVVFVAVLYRVGAHKMVLSGLDARGKAIADELAQASTLRQEAEALLASFDKKRAAAEAQAASIIAEAQAEAQRIAQDSAARLEEFITRRTAQAESKIALAEAQATAEVRAAAADHATRAAEILLTDAAKGQAGADIVTREIDALKARLN